MIALIDESRCIDCGACAEACPRTVFDVDVRGRPTIARQADCQTCFLCELYCPADALYVAPDSEAPEAVELEAARPQMGAFRRDHGWGEWADRVPNEHWRMGEIFERARALAATIQTKT